MPADEFIQDGDRRLRGLRGLRGYATPHAAVKELGIAMGGDTWADIEQPGRPRKLKVSEAKEIAAAGRFPFSFFTAPIEFLGDVRESRTT